MTDEEPVLSKRTPPSETHGVGGLYRIIANAGWLTIGRMIADLLGLLLFVVLARSYGPEGIGSYAYALGVAGLVYAGINLGVEDFAVRECARVLPAERGAFVGRVLVLQMAALVLVGAVVVGFLTVVSHAPDVIAVVAMLCIQQACFAVSRTLFAPTFAAQRMKGPAVAELIFRGLGITVGIYLIELYQPPVYTALAPLAVAGICLLLFSVRAAFWETGQIKLRVSWSEATHIVRTAWPFAGSMMLSYISLRSSFIIMGVMLGEGPTGLYASGMKLLEAVAVPLTFLGFAAYPRLSILYTSDHDRFWASSDRLIRVSLLAGVLVTWSLFFIGPELVVPLLGERFAASAGIVMALAPLALVMSVNISLMRLLLARNEQRVRLAIQATSVAVLLITTVAGLAIFGVYGAVGATYFGGLTATFLYGRSLGQGFWRPFRKPCLKFVLAIFGAVLCWVAAHIAVGGVWMPASALLVGFTVFILLSGFVPEEFAHPLRTLRLRASN